MSTVVSKPTIFIADMYTEAGRSEVMNTSNPNFISLRSLDDDTPILCTLERLRDNPHSIKTIKRPRHLPNDSLTETADHKSYFHALTDYLRNAALLRTISILTHAGRFHGRLIDISDEQLILETAYGRQKLFTATIVSLSHQPSFHHRPESGLARPS